MADPLVTKYAPLNVQRVTVPVSDRAFFTAGGRRDYPLWAVVNEFNSSYYSGLDVSIYFNEIYVDEVVQLSFSEMEQVRPIYGYADYTFRHVAHGTRIVQGSFAINFKDAGYIPNLLYYLAHPNETQKVVKSVAFQQMKNTETENGVRRRDNTLLTPTQEKQYESAHNILYQAHDWPAERIALARDLTLEDIINHREGGMDDDPDRYARVMNNLKREYWGDLTKQERREAASRREYQDKHAKYVLPRGGDNLGFDIILKYGQPEDYVGSGENARPGWGTIEAIKDCHITGFQKSVGDTGRNVMEVYNFIARTVA